MSTFLDNSGVGVFTVPGDLDAFMLSRGHTLFTPDTPGWTPQKAALARLGLLTDLGELPDDALPPPPDASPATLAAIAAVSADVTAATAATNTALALRVRADAAQSFTGPQQATARTNIGAADAATVAGKADTATVSALATTVGTAVQKGQTGATGTVYVSPSGSNSNDGLSAGTPFLTFQKAFDYLATQGPILQGVWTVIAAAGTYTGTFDQQLVTRSVNRVVVRGPAVSGGVPTAIISGAGGGNYQHGLRAGGIGVRVEFRDLKFINFNGDPAGTTRIGCVGEDSADVWFNNVHATGATWCGAYAFGTVRCYLDGGIYDGNRIGVSLNDTQASVTTGAVFKNSTEAGVHWSRGSQGHLDNCAIEDNVVGLSVSENSRVDTITNNFKRNGTAIRARTGGMVGSGGGTSNTLNAGTADANTTDLDYKAYSGDSVELEGAVSEARVGSDTTARTRTGSTAEGTMSTVYTIPARRLAGEDKSCRVVIQGAWTSVTAGSSIKIEIGGNATSLVVPSTAGGSGFQIEVTLFKSGGAWRSMGKMLVSVQNPRLGSTAAGFLQDSAQDVVIKATLANAADSLTIYRTDVFITG